MVFNNNNSVVARFLSWIRQHKILSTLIGCFVVFLLIIIIVGLTSIRGNTLSVDEAGVAPEMAYQQSADRASSPTADDGVEAEGDIPGVEIKTGRLSVDSADADADESVVRDVTADHDGYIEESSQSETNTRRRINMTTRVPSDDFADYTQQLRDQLEVEDYQLKNYRVEIEEQTTELDIIADTSAMYAAMKQEAQAMPLATERIELTMDITERQLELKERENRLQSRVDRVTRQGDMATLQVTLEERLSAEIWPEDLGNDFRDQLRETIQRVVDIAIAIVTTSLVVFMTVLQWTIWILISLIVLWLAYRLLRRLHKRWYK